MRMASFSLVGGMISTTPLTLIVILALYALLEERRLGRS